MSTRADIEGDDPRLAYTCRCGWLDLGHMNPASHRPNEGAVSLWDQVRREAGPRSHAAPGGFKVQYQQTHAKRKFGVTVRDGVYRSYWVKAGLSAAEQRAVALAIFMEVSVGFEALQDNWLYRRVTDSGFSAEDLVSNLIGFYAAVDPTLDPRALCGVVSVAASLAVWDAHGPVGQHKNRGFLPLLFPCPECPPKAAAGRAGKADDHRHGPHRVSIGPDGKVVVRPGDWLSGYSAAVHRGDTTRVHEYGRLTGGRMVPIADVNRIAAGETIYHVPTYEQSKAAPPPEPAVRTEPLPAEFRTITPIGKGTLFRDWADADERSRGEVIERRYPARWK